MDLVNYLDGLVVMKSLFEKNWTYWEKENTGKMESYVIDNPSSQIILFRPKKQEKFLISILFHNDKDENAVRAKEWMKNHIDLIEMQTSVSKRVIHNKKNLKISLGVKDFKELQEFFENVFREE